MEEEDEADDRQAISRLADAQVPIDQTRERTRSPTSPTSPTGPGRNKSDFFQDAIARPDTLHTESLQDRLDRVLAKVRDGKAKGRNSPSLRNLASGRTSPNVAAAAANGRASPVDRQRSPTGSQGRRSPYASTGGRDSPSIDQIIGINSRSPLSAVHGSQPSVTSLSSTGTDQSSTPVTASSNANSSSFTPISSVNSAHRTPVAYHPAFGLEHLMAIVEGESQRRAPRPRRDPGVDTLFGRSVDLEPETREVFGGHTRTLDELDAVRPHPVPQLGRSLADLAPCSAAGHAYGEGCAGLNDNLSYNNGNSSACDSGGVKQARGVATSSSRA